MKSWGFFAEIWGHPLCSWQKKMFTFCKDLKPKTLVVNDMRRTSLIRDTVAMIWFRKIVALMHLCTTTTTATTTTTIISSKFSKLNSGRQTWTHPPKAWGRKNSKCACGYGRLVYPSRLADGKSWRIMVAGSMTFAWDELALNHHPRQQ